MYKIHSCPLCYGVTRFCKKCRGKYSGAAVYWSKHLIYCRYCQNGCTVTVSGTGLWCRHVWQCLFLFSVLVALNCYFSYRLAKRGKRVRIGFKSIQKWSTLMFVTTWSRWLCIAINVLKIPGSAVRLPCLIALNYQEGGCANLTTLTIKPAARAILKNWYIPP